MAVSKGCEKRRQDGEAAGARLKECAHPGSLNARKIASSTGETAPSRE
jgi:hypothetical protein